MSESTMAAWMWLGNDTVCGLRLDGESGLLAWTPEIGCHCGGAGDAVQSVAAYRQQGVPAGITPPPADVTAEIEAVLARLDVADA